MAFFRLIEFTFLPKKNLRLRLMPMSLLNNAKMDLIMIQTVGWILLTQTAQMEIIMKLVLETRNAMMVSITMETHGLLALSEPL